MIKAVVFDLDGTLTNTLSDIASSMNRALRLNGLPEHEEQAYTKMIGGGVFKLVERAVGDHPDKLDAVLAEGLGAGGVHTAKASRGESSFRGKGSAPGCIPKLGLPRPD